MDKKFIQMNLLVIIISNSANVFAYLFQIIMGRYLTVEDFGVLNAINSLGVLVGALTGVIPYVVTKYIIEFKHDERMASLLIWKMFQLSCYVTILLGITFYLFFDVIKEYLYIQDDIPLYLFLLSAVSTLFLSLFYGVIQGLLMFVTSSFKGAGLAALRFVFAWILVVVLGYGYNGALGAMVLANIVIAIWIFVVMSKSIKFHKPEGIVLPSGIYRKMLNYALPIGLTWGAIGIMTNIDLVLVKHYTTPLEAGEYSVAAIIGRIAVFLPGVLLAILFPQVSQNNADGQSSLKTVITIMVMTFVLSGSFTILVYCFPEFVISFLFGDKYIGGAEALVVITLAMALVAVLSVFFNFFLAKHMYSFLYYTWGVIFIFGFLIMSYSHHSSLEIARMILYGVCTLLIVNLLVVWKHYYKGVSS